MINIRIRTAKLSLSVVCLFMVFLPLTLTEFAPNRCCNGSNIILPNGYCVLDDGKELNCTDENIPIAENKTQCQISLHCGNNTTYDVDFHLYDKADFYIDNNGNLILPHFHMFVYEETFLAPIDGYVNRYTCIHCIHVKTLMFLALSE